MSSSLVFIAYEIAAREIPYHEDVIRKLAACGYTVVIGQQQGIIPLLRLFRGQGFQVILKSADYGKMNNIKRLYKWGFKLHILEAESILVNPHFFAKTRLFRECLPYISSFMVTGEYQRNLLLTEYPEWSSKFRVVGREISGLDQRSKTTKSVENKVILVCTGFGFWNHIIGLDAQMNLLNGYLSDESSAELGYLFRKYSEQARLDLIDFASIIYEVSVRFAEFKFIIRVHPSEKSSFWESLAYLCPNIIIESNNALLSTSLLNSDLVISHPSTILYEAHLCSIPSICVYSSRFSIPETNYPNDFPRKLSTFSANNANDLCAILSLPSSFKYQLNNDQLEVLDQIANYSEEKKSYVESVVNVISEFRPSGQTVGISNSKAFLCLYIYALNIFVANVKSFVRRDFKSIFYGAKKRCIPKDIRSRLNGRHFFFGLFIFDSSQD